MSPQSPPGSAFDSDSKSTQPSSPAEQTPDIADLQKEATEPLQEAESVNQNGEPEEEEEEEDMGIKAKALTNLLKTSSVFVAIMADKMKEQQRQQKEQAKRQATKARNTEEKKLAATQQEPARRSMRAQQPANGDSTENKSDAQPNSRKMVDRTKGAKKTGAKKGIADFFKKENVEVKEDGPSVQEALAQAADEYETKPEGLGAQDLTATEQPSLVSGGKMRSYQLEGLEWMKSLWMNGLCGILADEMGLGKTVQAISMIAFLKEKNVPGPFLIAAPLSTLSNWVDEFARWTPSIKTVLYHGSKADRENLRRKRMKMQSQRDMDFPVICTSYEICMNDRKFLGGYQWTYIIVDEGHRLKNMNCRLIKELLTYRSANRLLITGTPLQNNIAELWSLLHFLLPEVFNDLDSFESWFDFSEVLDEKGQKTMEKKKRNLVSTMHAILKPFLLRRVKTDVETSLPKKREYILYAPMTDEQQELYKEIVGGNSRSYLEGKAVARIEAQAGRSRTSSLKRRAVDDSSGHSTPSKSLKSSRASTPGSSSAIGSARRGRPQKNRPVYADISDREFNAKLRRLENGGDEDTDLDASASHASSDDSNTESTHLASSIAAAKKEISAKKLQNPIMQARLACNSPHNFYWPWPESADPSKSNIDASIITSSGKLLLLERLVPRLFQLNHKILIFSQFKTTLDILLAWASEYHNWPCCRIDGSISQTDRQEQIRLFNDPDSDFRLFLLSTRAGGQGINLTSADTVILFDSDWNPQQDLQAMDRAHRIGQKRPVIVYRLATRGTVEEVLLKKAESKRKLEKLVIQKGKFRSLFQGIDSQSSKLTGIDAEEVKKILAGDDSANNDGFQRFDVKQHQNQQIGGHQILSENDLQILTDRSEEAYIRAEKGDELVVGGGDGSVFEVKETKREGEGEGMLGGMDGKS